MSWSRIALLSLVVVGAAVLAGALAQQPAKSTPPAAPKVSPKAEPAKPDPAANKAVDQTLEMLDRKRLAWLETTLWQQIDAQGLLLQSEGIYLAGPDYRLHLNLKVHLAETSGKMEIVSDGTTLWEVLQFGKGTPQVSKLELKKVLAALDGGGSPQLRDEYLQRWTFAGIAPLIKGLKQRMVFTKQEAVRWRGRDVIKVTGAWAPDIVKAMLPTEKAQWPAYMPRSCHLFLDAQTHWPHRIEWWGPSPPLDGDAILLQMEFRNPKFTEMSPERCARVFKYDAPVKDVSDDTNRMIAELNMRIRQLQK
jgi:hypothetical protein